MYNSLVRELVQAGRRTSCLGLINGKMGIAIALFRYARLSGELTCEDVGCELLDEIYEHLDSSIPISSAGFILFVSVCTKLNHLREESPNLIAVSLLNGLPLFQLKNNIPIFLIYL